MIIRYLDWNSGLVVSSDEDQHQSRLCDLQDIGGHIMKIPLVGFQILLFMRLEVYQVLNSAYMWMSPSVLTSWYSSLVLSHFREPHLVLGIFQFHFSLLLYFCCKELGSCLHYIDWWRKLFFYYIVQLVQKDTLQYLPKFAVILVSCTMGQGNAYF